jgi:hypothetical protein
MSKQAHCDFPLLTLAEAAAGAPDNPSTDVKADMESQQRQPGRGAATAGVGGIGHLKGGAMKRWRGFLWVLAIGILFAAIFLSARWWLPYINTVSGLTDEQIGTLTNILTLVDVAITIAVLWQKWPGASNTGDPAISAHVAGHDLLKDHSVKSGDYSSPTIIDVHDGGHVHIGTPPAAAG